MKAVTFCFALLGAVYGQEGGVPARMIVTVEGHHNAAPPQVTPADIMVYQDKDHLRVTGSKPLRGGPGLQLWILIDDGADSSLGSQFSDLRKFILGQPATSEIGIGYLRNGTVDMRQKPTASHDLAVKALRLPLAEVGISASPYMSLTDLIHKWPATERAREVLLITSGIDLFFGPGPQNPYLDRAIEDAQRAGVVVFSIYYGSSGHLGHSFWQINGGQNDLSQLADATGGEFYWQGSSNPVSFSPFLQELSRRLDNQYLVTFLAKPAKQELQGVKVRTEVPHLSLVAPSKVYVPAKD